MRHKLILTVLSFLLMAAGHLFAAEPVPYKLDDIVVTATRTETQIKATPANISVISKEEMEEKGATTLIDVFQGEPGVFPSNLLNNPKSSTIDIRGFGETAAQNSLFLIDGRRINDVSMSGADLMQIPIEMIERIEIYRSPATVLFGDNAIGGVINIILKKGEGKPTVKAGMNTGSYDLYNPYASTYGKTGKFAYYFLSSSYDTSGYRHNNGLHARDITGQFSFDIVKNLELSLRTGHHKDTYGMPGYLTKSDFLAGYRRKDTKTPDDFSSTEDNYLDVETKINVNENISISLGGAYRNRHTSFHYETLFGPWDSMRKIETFSLTPKITVKKDLFSLKNTLVGGIDYYYTPTRSNDMGTWTASTTSIDKTEYGLYLNDEIYLLKNLLVSAGYRIIKARYDFDYIDNTGSLSPVNDRLWKEKEAYRAGINYIFREDGNIFLNYAKGFRLPATDEYFNVYSTPPINKSLEPHEVKEIDLGIRWNFSKKLGGNLTVFSGEHKNEIFMNPSTFANENYNKIKREGLEASLSWILSENMKFDLGYSYIKAKFDGGEFDDNDVPLVPTHKFSGRISYTLSNFNFALSTTYIGERYMISDLGNNSRTLPGTTLYDLNILYKYKGIRAMAGIKNLTDKKYNAYGTYGTYLYPSTGRQYMFGLEYTY
jgi:iron complex outermembrane receptor protein